MNVEQQRFTSGEAEHIQLDMMGRQIETRIQVHTCAHTDSYILPGQNEFTLIHDFYIIVGCICIGIDGL